MDLGRTKSLSQVTFHNFTVMVHEFVKVLGADETSTLWYGSLCPASLVLSVVMTRPLRPFPFFLRVWRDDTTASTPHPDVV